MNYTEQSAAIAIKKGMALAFYASAWADLMEERGISLRGEIMEQMPDNIDHAAIAAADKLYLIFQDNLGLQLTGAFVYLHGIENMPDKSAQTFGHYVAMQAMGCGVGLFDYCPSTLSDKVPHYEFNFYDLEKDYL